MERLKKIFIVIFFISYNVFSYDFSYLENRIPPDSFEMRIYESIKDVIANGIPDMQHNMITFSWNGATVIIIESIPTRTRGYNNPDTIIIFTDQSFKELEIEEVTIIFNQRVDFYEFIIRSVQSDNTVRSNNRHILEIKQK